MVTIYIIWFFSFISTLHSITVNLSVEGLDQSATKQSIRPHETFTIYASVEANDDDLLENITIPGFDQLAIEGSSNTTSVHFVNGVSNAKVTKTFDVHALKPGVITIGPINGEYQGTKVTSNKLTLHVENQQKSSHSSTMSEKHPLQGSLSCQKSSLVEGEPTIVSLNLRFLSNVVVGITVGSLEVPGCSVQELKKLDKKQNAHERSITKYYRITPLEAGTKNIGPVTVTYQIEEARKHLRDGLFGRGFFSEFFGPQVINRQTTIDPLSLNVTPLPNHNVDGVGQFSSFSLKLDKKSAYVNEPLTLQLQLVGLGNLDQITIPQLTLPQSSKSYSSKTFVEHDLEEGVLESKKTFEYIVQIGSPGTHVIPAQKFTYYDTKTQGVTTLTSQPVTIMVTLPEGENKPSSHTPSQETPQVDTSKQRQDTPPNRAKNDIHFIEELPAHGHKMPTSLPWLLFLILLLLPFFLFYLPLGSLLRSLRKKFQSTASQNAYYTTRFAKELTYLDEKQNYAALYPLMIKILAHVFSLPSHEISEEAIRRNLEKKHWSQDKINELILHFNECAELSFAQHTKAIDGKKVVAKTHYWLLLLFANEAQTTQHKGI